MGIEKATALIVLVLVAIVGTATASELSEYTYYVNNQDNPRNVAMLKDMAYHFGGMDKLVAKMNIVREDPVLHVNQYARYNPATGNVEWTGTK